MRGDACPVEVGIGDIAPRGRCRWYRHSARCRAVSWLAEAPDECLPRPAGLDSRDLLLDHRVQTRVQRTPAAHEPPARRSPPRLQHLRVDRFEALKIVLCTQERRNPGTQPVRSGAPRRCAHLAVPGPRHQMQCAGAVGSRGRPPGRPSRAGGRTCELKGSITRAAAERPEHRTEVDGETRPPGALNARTLTGRHSGSRLDP